MSLKPTQDKAIGMLISTEDAGIGALPGPPMSRIRLRSRTEAFLEDVCNNLFRIAWDRRGFPEKIRLNWLHPLAVPFCCIFLGALPLLLLIAVVINLLDWYGRRKRISIDPWKRRITR